jgi:hypothetical protein
MTIKPIHGVDFFLFCLQNNHRFCLTVERREDITTSNIATSLVGNVEQGFVIYRDRTFVECPYCKSLCLIIPGTPVISTDIKYTPEKK